VSAAATPGRWLVQVGDEAPREYAGVVVCNGHHWDPRIPRYPGTFDGETMHSKAYRTHAVLDGKRVLVVGGGNSACDIASEAARFGESAHISLRRGYWFLPKTFLGVPSVELLRPWMPVPVQRALIRAALRLVVGKYEDYGLPRPDHRIFEKHPTINSELLHHIKHGRVTPRPDIARLDGRDVVFVDGTRDTFDVIVWATGYNVSFPFLDPGIIAFVDGIPQLIGNVVPPDRKNLYVFGLGQPRYGAGPLISAGADLLCTMVETQRELDGPLGAILARVGQGVPRTYLVDPHRALRQVRVGKRLVPQLPRVERWMRRRPSAGAAAS
jgi:cation diffusion facilitator CzcD-associated flavoprotein CzcO